MRVRTSKVLTHVQLTLHAAYAKKFISRKPVNFVLMNEDGRECSSAISDARSDMRILHSRPFTSSRFVGMIYDCRQ